MTTFGSSLLDIRPVFLIHVRYQVSADLLVGDVERATVSVVDDCDFFQLKKSIQNVDISKSMTNVPASIAMDTDFCIQS